MFSMALSHISTTLTLKSFMSVLTNENKWLLFVMTGGCFPCCSRLLMSCNFCKKNRKWGEQINHVQPFHFWQSQINQVWAAGSEGTFSAPYLKELWIVLHRGTRTLQLSVFPPQNGDLSDDLLFLPLCPFQNGSLPLSNVLSMLPSLFLQGAQQLIENPLTV